MLRRGISTPSVKAQRLQMWGDPQSVEDVHKTFVKFCEGKINRLPWCEMPIQAETSRIAKQLVDLNKRGFLTINSQPSVNGEPSTTKDVGWGSPGGRVYQKAYVEFFVDYPRLEKLLARLKDFPTMSYHAVNGDGEVFSNCSGRSVNAVTWGVFPDREIIQPTVVDSESFMIWKDEAFHIWLEEWRYLYDRQSVAYRVLSEVYESHFLVNIVENDFVNGDIFKLFAD
jgi:methylenetetrahydrofolate reductase (NADPH)